MNDKEIELQFRIVEEKYNSAISRLESRLSELNRDVKNYKENHTNEHSHQEKEIDLKLNLIKKDIQSSEKQLFQLEKEEQKNIDKKTLNYTAIGVWIGAISLAVMLFVQLYDTYYTPNSKAIAKRVTK